jgi:hypothetical protein
MQDSITADDMEKWTGLYDEEDVRSILLRLDGGVTSSVLLDAVLNLTNTMISAMGAFVQSGFPSQTELYNWGVVRTRTASSSGSSQGRVPPNMARVGAPSDFNIKCYRLGYTPATVKDLLDAGKQKYGQGYSCAHNMLMWIHNEKADPKRYGISPANGNPVLGTPGIQTECFRFRDADLFRMGGSDGAQSPFAVITEILTGSSTPISANGQDDPSLDEREKLRQTMLDVINKKSNSLMRDALKLGDFFQPSFNDQGKGLFMAEFSPAEIKGLMAQTPSFSAVESSIMTGSTDFARYAENPPLCVTVEAIKDELPECRPVKDTPTPLQKEDCDSLYLQALNDIGMYSMSVATPRLGASRPWPPPPYVCVWDCGGNWDGYNEPLHEGLDEATRSAFEDQLGTWKDECYRWVEAGNKCMTARTTTEVAEAMKLASRSEYTQEVCGKYTDNIFQLFDNTNPSRDGPFKRWNHDSIGKFVDSLLSDQTKAHADINYAYK